MLGKPMIITNLISKASGFGDDVEHTMLSYDTPAVYFERTPDGLGVDLKRLDLSLRTTHPSYDLLMKEGHWGGWLFSFPAKAVTSSSGNSFLRLDFEPFVLNRTLLMPANPARPGAPLGRLGSLKAYPRNLEMELEFKDQADGSSLSLHVSLALLPDTPMVGRVYDDRVGYFTTEYTNIGAPAPGTPPPTDPAAGHGVRNRRQEDLVDEKVKLVHRWRRLPPGSPCNMVYHIDPTIPAEWREYFKRGVEVWQPAFAVVGIPNCPVARLPGDPDWPADYEAGDIRYSSISQSISRDKTYSVGPSTVDPRSGEILDADISFAQEWVKAWTTEINGLAADGMDTVTAVDPARMHDPARHPASDDYRDAGGRDAHYAHYAHHHHHHRDHDHHRKPCMRLHGMRGDMLTAHLAYAHRHLATSTTATTAEGSSSSATMPYVPRDVIGAGLADVTAHEVGHTLGLRHNFKGSAAIPFEKRFDKAYTAANGLSSSVMDYVPTNLPDPTKAASSSTAEDGWFFTGNITVGRYDAWAIKYGYIEAPGEVTGVKHTTVDTVAAEVDAQWHTFASDGDAGTEQDPVAKRYDLTDDPVAWAAGNMAMYTELRKTAADSARLLPGDSYRRLYSIDAHLFYLACKCRPVPS